MTRARSRRARRWLSLTIAAGATLSLPACLAHHQVTVDPIEVKPIHLDVDVHLEWDDPPAPRRQRGGPAHRSGPPGSQRRAAPATDDPPR